MNQSWLSLRRAVRGLVRAPGFTAIAALSIGLGIGANTTVLSWLEAMVFAPFPAVPEANRLVGLNVASPEGESWAISYPILRDWREAARSVAGIAGWGLMRVSLRDASEQNAESRLAMPVSGNYFAVLGLRPRLGRLLLPGDERAATPVAVLSHDFWVRRFSASPSAIGQTIFLNGAPVAIVGVAPPRFVGLYVGVATDLWVPLTLQPRLSGSNSLDDRSARWCQGVARLAPGAGIAQARAEIDALARRTSTAHGDRPVTGALVRRIREQFLGGLVFPLFTAMLGVTTLLLLIACANVAHLLLVRASERRHELAVSVALGGGAFAVLRPMLLESLLLAGLGGALGTALAFWWRGAFFFFVPPTRYPILLPIELDARVLALTLLVTAVAALLFGLAPALRAARLDPAAALRGGPRSGSREGSRLRGALVVAQIAFSLLCLTCGGLYLRSLRLALAMDLGFSDPGHLLLVGTDFAAARLGEATEVAALDEVLRRARALPGVREATVASMVPLGFGGHEIADVRAEGHEPRANENLSAERSVVGPRYFETMGARLLSGRSIGGDDRAGRGAVAVVNESFVRRFWPGRNPLGRRLDAGRGWATVVGMVRDGKYVDLDEAPSPVVYLSVYQSFQPGLTLHLRTGGPPRALAEPMRRLLASVHQDLPAIQPRTLAEHIGAATFVQRLGASVLAVFGSLALVMSAIGLYGVLAFVVALRSRELAIRTALGASHRQLRWLVVRQSLGLTAAGLALGGVLSQIAARLLRAQLWNVSASDLLPTAAAAAALTAAALAATWLPTHRTRRVDPVAALRGD